MIMAAMLAVMMAVIVATGIVSALHPASNVEVIDPLTLHLQGEFVESNLGTAAEPAARRLAPCQGHRSPYRRGWILDPHEFAK